MFRRFLTPDEVRQLFRLSHTGLKRAVRSGRLPRPYHVNPRTPRWDPEEVEVALDYPPDGPHFESYQSWLVNNEVFLEKIKGGTRVRPPQGGMQTVKGAYPRALLRYYFENGKRRLGDPRDWKLVYRTPGRIVNLPVQFEFKDLPLR